MVLRFYNTLSKKKEAFRPLKKGRVSMYNCGPTVYDYAHIGNFRSYMFADLLRRYLEWKGFRVKQIMNITDVGHMTFDEVADSAGEDKIEKKAKEMKKDPWEISRFFTQAFFDDRDKLNIKPAEVYPKATEHVGEMISMIERLKKNGHAYESGGSVYYDVTSFRKYGRLSGNTIEKLRAGSRVEINPDKRNPYDFALWVKNPSHIMQWGSPWGRGYPGWHIECSAMSTKYLGDTLDIHTGGEDNIFPHHECEIAQTEGATGKTFVRYWMHARHLMVDGKKMSKSLGNFYTLRDLIEKGHNPKAIRYLLLSAHYRTKLNLTEQALKSAQKTVDSLEGFVRKLKSARGRETDKTEKLLKKTKKAFEKAMDDDLNISLALAALFDFTRDISRLCDRGEVSEKNALDVLEFMYDIDRVLGLELDRVEEEWFTLKEADSKVRHMLETREIYRKEKKWSEADRIRDRLKEMGIAVEDSPQGPRWKKA